MRLVVLSLALLAALSLSGAEQSDARFEKLVDRARKIFESNHMVVDLQLSSYDNKIPPAECHYDRYPGKVERIRLPEAVRLPGRREGNGSSQRTGANRENPLKARVRTS
jgi:hypothetical protein